MITDIAQAEEGEKQRVIVMSNDTIVIINPYSASVSLN